MAPVLVPMLAFSVSHRVAGGRVASGHRLPLFGRMRKCAGVASFGARGLWKLEITLCGGGTQKVRQLRHGEHGDGQTYYGSCILGVNGRAGATDKETKVAADSSPGAKIGRCGDTAIRGKKKVRCRMKLLSSLSARRKRITRGKNKKLYTKMTL